MKKFRLFLAGYTFFTLLGTISCNDDESVGNRAPTISAQSFSVAEDAEPNQLIGTVEAQDQDNDELTFAITDGNDDGIFAMNLATGELTLSSTGVLDFETKNSYELEVEVTDGKLFASAQITLTISDVEESNVLIAGETYELIDGALYDWSTLDPPSDEAAHYEYVVELSDGELTFDEFEEEYFSETWDIKIYVSLYSAGPAGFQDGTFNYVDYDDHLPKDIDGKSFFYFLEVYIDANDNNEFFETTEDETQDRYYEANGGSVEVIHNGNNNYTLNYNITLIEFTAEKDFEVPVGDEIPVTFSYTGDFNFFKVTDDIGG